MSGPPAVWSRSRQRLVHLLLGTALGAFVYSPLTDVPAAELAVQVIVFPALVLSGLLMWRGPRLRRWLARRRGDNQDM
jgi:membrane protein implicated in regulation of membrane protease activity